MWPRSRRTGPGSALVAAQGALVASAATVAVVGFGGVHPPTRAAVHALLAASFAVAAVQPSATLSRAGRALPVAGLVGLLLASVCTGLLPLPSFLGRWVAPAWPDERGPAWLGLSTLRLEDTVTALTHWLLPGGFAVALAVFGSTVRKRRHYEDGLVVLTVVVLGLGAAHVLAGADRLFGIVAPENHNGRFFAPFVNPNHFGGFLLLAFPLALGGATGTVETRQPPWALGVLAVAIVGAALWAGAGGPLFVLGAQAVAVAARRRWVRWWLTAPLAVGGLVLSMAWASRTGALASASLGRRFEVWVGALRLWGDHWLLGSGAGTFHAAIEPYRTDVHQATWTHAHSDWLEWAAESGVVGVGLLVVAAVLLRRTVASDADRGWLLGLGGAGVLLHAVVDFPLQIPAIAMGAAGGVAWRIARFDDRTSANAAVVRGLVVALAVAEAGGAAWQVRGALVEPAARALVARDGDLERPRAILATLAPWREEVDRDRLITASSDGPEAVAAAARRLADDHPESGSAQGVAAWFLARTGARDEALARAERAVSRSPADFRTWRTRARVHDAVAAEDAPAAWRDAVVAGVPEALDEGWKRLPVGLYWVDALEDAPPEVQARVAAFVYQHGDADAALVGFEKLRLDDPERFLPLYVDALVDQGRIDEATAYLVEAADRHPEDPEVRRRLAEVAERNGDWARAAEVWWELTGRYADARLRAVLAVEKVEGPGLALARLDRQVLLGERLRKPEALARARLQRDTGRPSECVRTLAENGLLEDREHGATARALMEGCTARKPAGAP